MSGEEFGKLWESWLLAREIDGDRQYVEQVLLIRLRGDRWRLVRIPGARIMRPRAVSEYDSEQEVRSALATLYAEGSATGEWQIRFLGRPGRRPVASDGRPHW